MAGQPDEPAPPVKRGRGRPKGSTKQKALESLSSKAAAPVESRMSERPRKQVKLTDMAKVASSLQTILAVPGDSAPKKRGRPRKHPVPDTKHEPVDTDSQAEAPKKRGRPHKQTAAEPEPPAARSESPSDITSHHDPPRTEQAPVVDAEPVAANSSSPRKRGRPRKDRLLTADTEPAISPVSKKRARPHKDHAPVVDAKPTKADSSVPRKRGRPRKDQALALDTEPAAAGSSVSRKRGRPRKQTAPESDYSPVESERSEAESVEEPVKRRGLPKDDENQKHDGLSAEPEQSSDKVLIPNSEPRVIPVVKRGRPKGGKNRPREQAAATVSSIGQGESASTSNVPETPKKKFGRPPSGARSGPAWLANISHRRDEYWAGPCAGQQRTNPMFIDVGLDEDTWTQLRSVSVDPGSLATESDLDVVRKYLPNLGAEEEGAVAATMLKIGAEEPGSDDAELRLRPFDAQQLPEARGGFIANVDELVTSIDWALARDATHTDYIATGGLGPGSAGSASMGILLSKRVREPMPGAIQLWRLESGAECACQLDMVLMHEFGRCLALRWCPVSTAQAGCIGILAAIFGDGHLRVCAVPEPNAIRRRSGPVYAHWPQRGLADIRAPHGVFTALDWACGDVLVAGTSRGSVIAWHMDAVLAGNTAPIVHHQLHSEDIRSISVYCVGSAPENDFNNERNASGFRRVDLADLQVLTLGIDGRFRQLLLQSPTRLNTAIEYPSRRTPAGAAYWPYGSCIYSEVDKALRLLREPVLSAPRDPWIRSTVGIEHADAEAPGRQQWNQWLERPSLN
ncbi:hypothetical protein IWW51_002753, partial [Coemansia sp. RSA 2702]